MRHQQVIDNFIKEGRGGLGTYMRASQDLLYSKLPQRYAPWGNTSYANLGGGVTPLAVRLDDGKLLINGASLPWPVSGHQTDVLNNATESKARFGVVPFHSIAAAWTDGKVRDWNEAPIPIPEMKQEVAIVVPSTGERWREVTEKDSKGREHTRRVHTLGDSVIRLRDRYYISAVDETGVGNGMYFLAELLCDRPPGSFEEALNFLKPKVVQEAEARGSNVRRQGEWFTIPVKRLTSELMSDVERGVAVFAQRHVLGRDGHHELEEAVIYRAGARKGEVYARGVLKHTQGQHEDLDLGTVRWHLVVHNIAGDSYTLG